MTAGANDFQRNLESTVLQNEKKNMLFTCCEKALQRSVFNRGQVQRFCSSLLLSRYSFRSLQLDVQELSLIPVSRRELDDIMTKITTKDDSKSSYGLIAFCLDNELHVLSDKREKQQQTDAI